MAHISRGITPLLLVFSFFAPLTHGYQTMRIPTPLRYVYNQFSGNTPGENYTLTLTPAQFPCKGYLSDMMTDPLGAGQSVTTYRAGESASIYLTGQSLGGSGQISISGNNGSLTVIHSYEGDVGSTNNQALDFVFPADAPLGTIVLSFTYFPLNSFDVYQSCAAVEIFPPRADAIQPSVSFAQRPDIFISDLENGCQRDQTKEVMFPDAGPDTTMNHSVPLSMESNTVFGTCFPLNGFGNGAKINASGINFPKPNDPNYPSQTYTPPTESVTATSPQDSQGMSSAAHTTTTPSSQLPITTFATVVMIPTTSPGVVVPTGYGRRDLQPSFSAQAGFTSGAPTGDLSLPLLFSQSTAVISSDQGTSILVTATPTCLDIFTRTYGGTTGTHTHTGACTVLASDVLGASLITLSPSPTSSASLSGVSRGDPTCLDIFSFTVDDLTTSMTQSGPCSVLTEDIWGSITTLSQPSLTETRSTLKTAMRSSSTAPYPTSSPSNSTTPLVSISIITDPNYSIPLTSNNTCGPAPEPNLYDLPGTRCPNTLCCSGYGFCGSGADYCGSFTCLKGYGFCSTMDNGTLTVG